MTQGKIFACDRGAEARRIKVPWHEMFHTETQDGTNPLNFIDLKTLPKGLQCSNI